MDIFKYDFAAPPELTRYLAVRSTEHAVLANHINYLLQYWGELPARYELIRNIGFDEYLADLERRRLAADILPYFEAGQQSLIGLILAKADQGFRRRSRVAKRCVAGEDFERKHRLDRDAHWYYYRLIDYPAAAEWRDAHPWLAD